MRLEVTTGRYAILMKPSVYLPLGDGASLWGAMVNDETGEVVMDRCVKAGNR
jgi:hypothetical protein